MPSGSPFHGGLRRASLALCAILAAACSSTVNGKGDAGQDSGPAWLHLCGSVGASCSGETDCCTDLSCQSGSCQTPAPKCAGYLEACGGANPACCEPSGASPLLVCDTLNDGGLSLCLAPQGGTSACTQDSDCPAPYWCVQGVCNLSLGGPSCNPLDKNHVTPCAPHDLCISTGAELGNLESGDPDPCASAGLTCIAVSQTQGLCVTPSVETPLGWSPDGVGFDPGICNPADNQCAPYYTGAEQTAPTCSSITGESLPHCVASCTTGDDCDSIAVDCVKGACLPNYCYADGQESTNTTYAQYYTSAQKKLGGIPVSSDPTTLFTACPLDAGFPTACLPEYQDLEPSAQTIGECVRVGGPGAGGWGDPCDPNPYRNNLGGLCQFGYYCYLGTCQPWCDIGSNQYVQCPQGTTCEPLATGALNSTATGATHAIGVCTEGCNPYLPDDQNPCQPFPTDAGQASLGCKLSGNGSDTSPPAGNCVAMVHDPIAVGDSCTPFEWLDPCASGAQCLQVTDGGLNWVCRQLCDPAPSANADSSPACPSGQGCHEFTQCASSVCSHEGDCE